MAEKTKAELKKEIQQLEEKLEKAEENAKNNYEYARQADLESQKMREEMLNGGHRLRDTVDTISEAIETTENIMKLTRKALQHDLTKKNEQETAQTEEEEK